LGSRFSTNQLTKEPDNHSINLGFWVLYKIIYGKPNQQNTDIKVSDTSHAIHNSSIMKMRLFAVLFYQLLFVYTISTFEELKWHACHFILSKWQSFTDLNGTIRAVSNLQWSQTHTRKN
jgi:hypothetical protein